MLGAMSQPLGEVSVLGSKSRFWKRGHPDGIDRSRQSSVNYSQFTLALGASGSWCGAPQLRMVTRCTFSVFLMAMLCVAGASWLASPAHAEPSHNRPPTGIAANGLCGLNLAEYPTCPAYLVTASGTAGYGHTESVGPIKGSHVRLGGSLGVGFVPLEWLAVSARLDGRLDIHPPDPEGPDGTMVGDPRLAVRLGRQVAKDFSVGGGVGLWIPGANAPSLRLKAASIDMKALGAYRPNQGPLSLLGTVGFRLDNSHNSAPDLRRLRPGDRLSLSLSEFHAVLGVLGLAYTFEDRAEVFVELSADVLIGAKAPSLLKSPLRASVGGRYFLGKMLQLEVTVTASLSQRPSLSEQAVLVPVEPRVYATTGLRFGLPSRVRASQPVEPTPTEEPVEAPPIQIAPVPQIANVAGSILDAGGVALPEAHVILGVGEAKRETFTDTEGRYTFTEVPLGLASMSVSATGFVSQEWEITVVSDMPALSARNLSPAEVTGLLRCLTRTFGSEPLKAQIVVRDSKGKEVVKGESDAQGRFEIKVPEGSYQVIITASGYRSHRRNVNVSSNGVAILNVDMREKR